MAVSVWVCFRTSGEYLYKRSRRSPGVLQDLRNSPGTLPALSRSSHGALSALSLAFSRRSAGALPGALELFPRRSSALSPALSPAISGRCLGALPALSPALSRHLSSAAPVRNFIPDPQILSIICDAARHASQVPRLRAAPGRPTFRSARKKSARLCGKMRGQFCLPEMKCLTKRKGGSSNKFPKRIRAAWKTNRIRLQAIFLTLCAGPRPGDQEPLR